MTSLRKPFVSLVVAGCGLLLFSSTALAHVSVSGLAVADSNQILTIDVGHGCAGVDTYRVEIQIPAEVVSLRALPGPWGDAEITTDAGGVVTQVAWEKPDVRDADDQYYRHQIRIRVPDMAFETLYFPAIQYCRTPGGVESTHEWTALPGEKGDPAAHITIVPERRAGWNKYTAPAAIDDLSMFDDAQIVWVGDAAYSSNPATMSLIATEPDVDELTSISAGAEIWVKY